MILHWLWLIDFLVLYCIWDDWSNGEWRGEEKRRRFTASRGTSITRSRCNPFQKNGLVKHKSVDNVYLEPSSFPSQQQTKNCIVFRIDSLGILDASIRVTLSLSISFSPPLSLSFATGLFVWNDEYDVIITSVFLCTLPKFAIFIRSSGLSLEWTTSSWTHSLSISS